MTTLNTKQLPKFAITLKDLREKRCMTQQEVANAAGISHWQTLSRWESGAKKPSMKNAKLLAEYYGVEAYLLREE